MLSKLRKNCCWELARS